MINAKQFFDSGLALHKYRCPSMPLGLRLGEEALNKLGVSPTGDTALFTIWMGLECASRALRESSSSRAQP